MVKARKTSLSSALSHAVKSSPRRRSRSPSPKRGRPRKSALSKLVKAVGAVGKALSSGKKVKLAPKLKRVAKAFKKYAGDAKAKSPKKSSTKKRSYKKSSSKKSSTKKHRKVGRPLGSKNRK